jgi:hypothetical protein
MKDAATVPLEARLLRLFEELGIDRAHIATRDAADWRAFASVRPGRLASLSLLCPMALDPSGMAELASPVLTITGDRGVAAERVGKP